MVLILCAQANIFCLLGPQHRRRKQYSKPALPYGPKDQKPWYKGRGFESSDFQEQSMFEYQRQETKALRQNFTVQVEESALSPNDNKMYTESSEGK